MKTCFKCNTDKPYTEFYRHKMMGDGYLGKCKECTKADSRANRSEHIEYYRAYDRQRANLLKRKKARKEYAEKKANPEAIRRAKRAYAERNPLKRSAQIKLCNAVRDGRVIRKPCEVCGDHKSHGHHDDYSKPLEVRWLCPKHHSEHHKAVRELQRSAINQ